MEATIKQTSISINICALQSAKQYLFEAINQHFNIGALTLPRLYRKQIRLVQALANAIEKHPVVTDVALWIMGIAIAVETFLYA